MAEGAPRAARHIELAQPGGERCRQQQSPLQRGIGKVNARSEGARDQTLVTCDANDDFVFPLLKKGGLLFR